MLRLLKSSSRFSAYFSFSLELLLIKLPQTVDSVNLLRRFVRANPFDPRKAQREFGFVVRAALNLIICYFHDDLRLHLDGVIGIGNFQFLQVLRHPFELGVGEAFKSFSDHQKLAGLTVAHGEMIV